MNQAKSYLSIVVTSRNDDHGGAMFERMTAFVHSLDEQAIRHRLDAELVIVDWNPPSDKPFLHEIIPAPRKNSPLIIRHVIVPNEIHIRWKNSDKIPLFQMIAKNVGIRHAEGEFVLATNVDILFSDKLCDFLAKRALESNKMYRANRCDVPKDVLKYTAVEEQIRYCEKNIIRRFGHIPTKRELLKQFIKQVLRYKNVKIPELDTDACGDFTLLSKKAWEEIRGYPELGMYSIYVDGLGVYSAAVKGYEQVILPKDYCISHIEHDTGWMSMSVIEKIKLMQDAHFWIMQSI